MKATAKDLRYNLKNIMESVDRGEEVLITNRGKIKARILPVDGEQAEGQVNPMVGMWSERKDMQDVDSYVRGLRKGRVL
ncbi:type II toxin-antitoxin system prevent-host-death family antitoxin [Pontiellaceae bacterium B12227]|nr:type II toxin-antitoxin system prevent-host-death family antitoxin [Pontiellaceae bacterium B12227]